ncbi:uncharacterized protein LOC125118207 isoform X2 [Phacochoerus africanus]|uniref:uncharacterized protein LOC125118207 isoform X2 n=1 Tax=Phacochoerus africanus TaxID=41426 RepID=UPI001FD89B81|nr:uncharacterized protein LOC125118207 isoform X2 [Phacochoerus africanus]
MGQVQMPVAPSIPTDKMTLVRAMCSGDPSRERPLGAGLYSSLRPHPDPHSLVGSFLHVCPCRRVGARARASHVELTSIWVLLNVYPLFNIQGASVLSLVVFPRHRLGGATVESPSSRPKPKKPSPCRKTAAPKGVRQSGRRGGEGKSGTSVMSRRWCSGVSGRVEGEEEKGSRGRRSCLGAGVLGCQAEWKERRRREVGDVGHV